MSKLDANGNFLWAKSIGGKGGEGIWDITLDGSGDVYLSGGFSDTVDFDPGAGIYNLIPKGDAFRRTH